VPEEEYLSDHHAQILVPWPVVQRFEMLGVSEQDMYYV
jgi:hypothetical protein